MFCGLLGIEWRPETLHATYISQPAAFDIVVASQYGGGAADVQQTTLYLELLGFMGTETCPIFGTLCSVQTTGRWTKYRNTKIRRVIKWHRRWAEIAQSLERRATGWTAKVRFPAGEGYFPFLHRAQIDSGGDWVSIQRVQEALSPEVKKLGCEAGHPPPSSVEVKNGGAIPPLPSTSQWGGA
jgi:hypothetical protein